MRTNTIKIYAHRGSSIIWPENTMFAFEQAAGFGATGFETDLQLSRDGKIVLVHDKRLWRFGQPNIKISDCSTAELAEVEVSSRDGQYRDRIPTLRQLLQAFPDHDYIFDCKISSRQLFVTLRALLDELKFENRTWFLTWSKRADSYVREFFPGSHFFPRYSITVAWGWMRLLRLGKLYEPTNEILALPAFHMSQPLITKQFVKSVQRQGKTFLGYLVNDRKAYEQCKASGVTAVLTDRSDLVAQWNANSDPKL